MTVLKNFDTDDLMRLARSMAESAIMLEIGPNTDEWYQFTGPICDRLYEMDRRFDRDKFIEQIRTDMEDISA